jgi:hypothetical protein
MTRFCLSLFLLLALVSVSSAQDPGTGSWAIPMTAAGSGTTPQEAFQECLHDWNEEMFLIVTNLPPGMVLIETRITWEAYTLQGPPTWNYRMTGVLLYGPAN